MLNNHKLERLYELREEIAYNLIEAKGDKVFKLEEKLEKIEDEIFELEQERDFTMDYWQKYAD